jgi:peptide chain release factor 1
VSARHRKSLKPLQDAWSHWIAKKQVRSLIRHRMQTNSFLQEIQDALSLYESPELLSLAQSECTEILAKLNNLALVDFPALLIPPSDTGDMSALMELKSGVGGSESSLFLAELLRVYTRYAHANNLVPAVVAKDEHDAGGVKNAILEVQGKGAYDMLRWESGVHRVQRVPATEASGRVHTSTVAIVVCILFSFNR